MLREREIGGEGGGGVWLGGGKGVEIGGGKAWLVCKVGGGNIAIKT